MSNKIITLKKMTEPERISMKGRNKTKNWIQKKSKVYKTKRNGKIFTLFTALVLILAIWIGYQTIFSITVPDLPRDQYWGSGVAPSIVDESIRPFKIEFSEEMITDLRNRLDNTRFSEPYEDIGFQYGFNHNELKKIVKFWLKEYHFTEREKLINSYPHFKTTIQGLDMHFIQVKPTVDKSTRILPLLLLHGWPGSVKEFYKIIPILTEKQSNNNNVFELIIPSLPGFGFSQAPSRPGLGTAQIAVIMSNLMKRMGHHKYYVQGGDWGSIIGSNLATLFPREVLGYHSNMSVVNTPKSFIKMLIGSLWPTLFIEEMYVHRIYPLKDMFELLLLETGHYHIQATKPDTLGAGLEDSPSGLAAWVLEKFSTGTNETYRDLKDGGLTRKYTYSELIDNLMMYWVPKSATTSSRIYAETVSKAHRELGIDGIPTDVPTAVAYFPNDIGYFTRSQLEEKYTNLLQISHFDEGGHFAAMEVPHLLAGDIFAAINTFDEFYAKN